MVRQCGKCDDPAHDNGRRDPAHGHRTRKTLIPQWTALTVWYALSVFFSDKASGAWPWPGLATLKKDLEPARHSNVDCVNKKSVTEKYSMYCPPLAILPFLLTNDTRHGCLSHSINKTQLYVPLTAFMLRFDSVIYHKRLSPSPASVPQKRNIGAGKTPYFAGNRIT